LGSMSYETIAEPIFCTASKLPHIRYRAPRFLAIFATTELLDHHDRLLKSIS
jgi:hypothetical protein